MRHRRMCHSENKVVMVCDVCEKEFHSIEGLRTHKSLYKIWVLITLK